MTGNKEVTILLVEDDPGHARLIEKNLRRSNVANPIVKVNNGQAALDHIFGNGKNAGAKRVRPLLVLLDLNLPIVDGHEVLRRMRADKDTENIPVIILSSLGGDFSLVKKARSLGVADTIVKSNVSLKEVVIRIKKVLAKE